MCYYEEYNETDITDTDFGTDIQLIQNANITLNESVHLIGDVSFCQGVCAQSLLNDGYECWAFTFNELDRYVLRMTPRWSIIRGGSFLLSTFNFQLLFIYKA